MSKDENSGAHTTPDPESWYREIVEDYREELEEFYRRKDRSETVYSLLLILSSLLGALLLRSTDVFSVSSDVYEFAPILAGVFAILAFGAALGIARWALFDLVSTINVLR